MIVQGVQRPRAIKRTTAERLLFAGFFLALSTQTISYQDALSRFEAGVQDKDRWRTHLVARSVIGDDGAAQRYAALIGPGINKSTGVNIDPITTGSVAASVNRIAKSDLMVERKWLDYSSGALASASPFEPLAAKPAGIQMAAFVPPAKPATAQPADKAAPATAVAAADEAATKPAKEAEAAPTETKLIAYAPQDDGSSDAPFDAVIGDGGKKKIVLMPKIGANHAWVNYALPANARSKKETKCLANAIYFEARGEAELGRIAVAQVVINRLKNPAYPNTICSVVYQNKHKRNRCQFSFACDGIRDRVSDKKSWSQAQALAKKILNDDRLLFIDEVGASTHYHANYVRPRWARSMKKKKKIGRHIFYQTYGGGWS